MLHSNVFNCAVLVGMPKVHCVHLLFCSLSSAIHFCLIVERFGCFISQHKRTCQCTDFVNNAMLAMLRWGHFRLVLCPLLR